MVVVGTTSFTTLARCRHGSFALRDPGRHAGDFIRLGDGVVGGGT
jgi:hypothetical protein